MTSGENLDGQVETVRPLFNSREAIERLLRKPRTVSIRAR
jgi:hypothetical protein